MSWLLPSVVFNLVAILILSLTYLYLYYKDRERCTFDWFIAWLLYSLRFGLEAMSVSSGMNDLYRPFIELLTVASALFLIRGTAAFTNQSISKVWYVVGIMVVVGSFIHCIYTSDDYFYQIIAFYFTGAVFIKIAYHLYKAEIYTGRISKVLAFIFLIWGFHKFNYPFLRYIENYAILGFAIAGVLTMLAAIGILLVYIENNRTKSLREVMLFKSIFENHSSYFMLIDSITGRIEHANPAACKFYGYSNDEITQKYIYEINTADIETINSEIQKVRNKEKNYFDFNHRLKDGSIRNVQINATTNNIDGKDMIFSIIQDVTEQYNNKNMLVESEYKFRSIFETMPNPILIINLTNNKILDANAGFYLSSGYHSNEVIGNDLDLLNLWKDREYESTFEEIIARDGFVQNYEAELFKKDGTYITALLAARIVNINSEAMLLITYNDVTLIKLYQSEIQELNSELELKVAKRTEQLHKALHDLTLEIEERRRIQEELEDSNFELKELNDTVIKHSHSLLELNEKLSASEAELIELNKKLEYKVLLRTQELETLNSKLEEASNLKTIILNNLGHELRTPLNGALGFTAILQKELHDEEYRDMAAMANSAMKRLERTLNSLMLLTEIESNKQSVFITQSNLSIVGSLYFSSIVSIYELQDVEFNSKTNEANLNVLLDEQLLYQILYNIIDNSVKHTSKGSISVNCRKVLQESEYWGQLSIIDTGCGIRSENIGKIFQPFRQESEGIARLSEGLGLGLTISQKLMEQMNGKILIESELGKGTEVQLLFKMADI